MTVKDYYYRHFNELSLPKQFHFALRIKNYFKSSDFDNFLMSHIPDTDLAAVFNDNNYSGINFLDLRRPFFEKYPNLFGLEATLFRVNHLLNEYNIDTRPDFQKLCSKEKLYQTADDLLDDTAALAALSTWAANTICLTELLFPRQNNILKKLGTKALSLDDTWPTLLVYLLTHIILCDSNFYTRPLTEPALARQLLDRAATIIVKHYDELSMDAKLEFLVCTNLAEASFSDLRTRISAECQEILKTRPFLIDYRRPVAYQTLDRSEHRNVLFIMSGLD